RAVPRLVFRPIRDVVPDEAGTMGGLLVDADDPIARSFQKAHDLPPSAGIVPVFALGGALNRDADVGLGDRPRLVLKRNTRRDFSRIDTENVSGGAMQADMAEVARLVDEFLIVEEQADAVCCVVALDLDLFGGHECDVRIGIPEQRYELVAHEAGEPA